MSDPTTPTLRASDAERETVGQALRRHHAEGRIDTDELQERISRCYGARTQAELEVLLADLPREPRAEERSGWPQGRRRLQLLVPILILLVALGSSGHGHHPVIWPVLVLAFVVTRVAGRRMLR